MTQDRLAAGIEAGALLRVAEALGGFGAVLHRGDAERGTTLLLVRERGRPVACLARSLDLDGRYSWARVGPANLDEQQAADMLCRRRHADPDEWQIDLDIPSSERFIAETIATG